MNGWLRLVLLLGMALPQTSWGQTAAALHCQLDDAPWRPCRMTVAADGLAWELTLAGRRYPFRHDGRGLVSLRLGTGRWQPVPTRWRSDGSLCWGPLCAQGPIPLD